MKRLLFLAYAMSGAGPTPACPAEETPEQIEARCSFVWEHPPFLEYADETGALRTCPPAEQPWFCEDYIAEGEPPFPGCVYEGGRDEWRALVCTGQTDTIPDDDPALGLFREAEPDSMEARKAALAIARVNSCD